MEEVAHAADADLRTEAAADLGPQEADARGAEGGQREHHAADDAAIEELATADPDGVGIGRDPWRKGLGRNRLEFLLSVGRGGALDVLAGERRPIRDRGHDETLVALDGLARQIADGHALVAPLHGRHDKCGERQHEKDHGDDDNGSVHVSGSKRGWGNTAK